MLHHGVQLFGDHRFAGIRPETGRRQVEDRGVVLHLTLGDDRVAEADVHLKVEACPAEGASDPGPQAAVPLPLANVCQLDGCRIEVHAVRGTISAADVLYGQANRCMIVKSERQEIHVSRWTRALLVPHAEERRSLQGESVHLV